METRAFETACAFAACVVIIPCSAQCTPEWHAGVGAPGMNWPVHAVAEWDPDLGGPLPPVIVVGGDFTTAGGVSANRVAQWNGSSWSALGNGLNDRVYELAPLPDGRLAAAGAGIRVWNGAFWQGVGSGLTGTVWALAVYPNGNIAAGGPLWWQGSHIALWNGVSWTGIGHGVQGNDGPYALAVMPNGDLIAAGDFWDAGGVANTRGLARWNGLNWTSLAGWQSGALRTILVRSDDDILVGGGIGSPPRGVARWNGSSWTTVGLLNDYVYGLAVLADGSLVAGGMFSNAGGVPMNGVARWDGSAWSALDGGLPGSHAFSLALTASGTIVAGGMFGTAGTISSSHVALWGCPSCYADCSGDGALTVGDFGCFQTRFVIGDPWVDCNGDGLRSVADFGCFQTRFVQGCP